MFTVCPKCALTLVVTAADLRVGQGYVRCGRCSNVFNALVGLSEEQQPAESPRVPAPASAAIPEASPEVSPIATATEPPADPPEDEPPSDAALEFDPVSTDVSEVFVSPDSADEDSSAATVETIVLEGDEPASDDIDQELRALAAELDAAAGTDAPPDRGPVLVRESRASPDPLPPTAEDAAAALSATDSPAQSPDGASARRRMRAAWVSGAAVLALLLTGQIVHHNHHELAANPYLRRPLGALYAAMGMPLVPRWDLSAYEVRQLGAFVDSAGGNRLTVRASLKNSATQPQPLPLLRVTLQDRFGNPIAGRDVPPEAYLPASVSRPPRAALRAGQRVDAEMAFEDPGREAVGFEIDACLPAPGGGIACANQRSLR